METRNFLTPGLIGGVVCFFVGWLLWGVVFQSIFPTEGSENLLMIALGCLATGLFVAYIYVNWADIASTAVGVKAGAVIGFFLGLIYNFFKHEMAVDVPWDRIIFDVVLNVISTAVVGGAIGYYLSRVRRVV